MEPTDLLILAAAAAALAIGFTRRKRRPLAFDEGLLVQVKQALQQQGFTIESYEHVRARDQTLRTTALGVRLGERVVGSLAPARDKVSASMVVHGMKTPSATFRVGRAGERGPRLPANTEVATGDRAFDARHKVNGGPDETVRAILGTAGVAAAIEALFSKTVVRELRLLALGDHGGAVRVEVVMSKDGLDAMSAIAELARGLADAIEQAP